MKTRDEYLRDLSQRIAKLPAEDRSEILTDYEDHFVAGLENGRSEEEICRSLGTPKSVAQEILMTTWAKKVDQAPVGLRSPTALLQIAMTILIMAPFNFIILIFPFTVLFAFVVAGWAIPISLGGVTVGMLGYFWTSGGDPVGFLSGLSLFFMFLGGLGLTFLSALLMWGVSFASLKLLIAFFKWNIAFINARRPRAALQGSAV